jgi:hypothetical protein
MHEHEYAVIGGINRSKIGRYLSLLAATTSAAIVFILLTAVDLAKALNLPVNLPPVVLSLVGAGSVFTALYWIFDRYAWRWPGLCRLIQVPNLNGEWHCDGQTINPDQTVSLAWNGSVTISQSWDKIRVRLSSKTSSSNSVSAAIYCDAIDGYRLMYHYVNEPGIGQIDLTGHRGFAELVFAKDRQSATGEYFNGHGRFTFGTLLLRRL